MAELTAEIKCKVTFEAVQNSPQLQDLLRQLIREELAVLDQNTADKLATQVVRRMTTVAGLRK